ncbi:ABC transporter permease [Azohydromonas caseinilytica]|uniref:ABC transporter permease subunit n=1 Tax=Azohydromonas caseinilytica TaxID=2728836 RepID=A0A848FEW7_9BURK|nr:ABC transporter permease subunit [Azohydromonas caseinilytica]NML16441.1 ABC transporter permease subunit [Azohydromonas caseinilytica]
MSSLFSDLSPALARRAPPRRPLPVWWTGALSALAWAAFGLLTWRLPNVELGFSEWAYTTELGVAALLVAALMLLVAATLPALAGTQARLARVEARLRHLGPWLVALPLLLALWELLTAKLAWLPAPFFAPPQSLIEVYGGDHERLVECAAHSLLLLSAGVAAGTLAGFVTGVAIGWSRNAGYWVHPVLRFLGPIPSTALLPIAFFLAPSSWSAAAFLIALATGFPVTVLTWSGVAGVNRQFYDVARTLGASEWFLIWRVAVPAALPQVFVGLFMGLGASFSVLVAAEMMGVKAGLGWYLTWAQGWAAYTNMFAALFVMAALFSGLISALFAVRDRALAWQKGTLKW